MKDYSDIKLDILSEITAKMGYGLALRREIKPLIEGGADIKIVPDEDYLPPHMKIEDPFWTKFIEESSKKPENEIRLCYCLPPRARFTSNNKIKIIRSMWETDSYPREWAGHINNVADYFLAGCTALVKSAEKAGIKIPIIPMHHTLDIDQWSPQGPRLDINEVSDDLVKFLFIGNFIPRKNLEELLLGFACAFDGYKDVVLVIKTWATSNDANGKKHIADAIRHVWNKITGLPNKPRISLITDILEEDQIIGLIRTCDVYTSVAKGEGFDLPMMQAMALEKLIVTTRFLAHSDYLDDSNSINVPFTLSPCVDAMAPLYDSYQMWSTPDVAAYIEALREAYRAVKDGRAAVLGQAARNTIKNNYSQEVNTDKIANIIRDIRDGKYKKERKNSKILIKELAG